ncbi:hypothetical protein ES702_01986 [subsurface metagenome]
MLQKLSVEKIEAIEQLSREGLGVVEIAHQVGCSPGAVSKYRLSPSGLDRPTIRFGKNYRCPRCAHQTFLLPNGKRIYLVCLDCGWAGFVGKYTLPEKIEDIQEEFT